MRILAQFPTLGRPEKFLSVLAKYVETASVHNEIFFNINCDAADLTMTDPAVLAVVYKILNSVDSKHNVTGSINFDHNTDKIGSVNANIDSLPFEVVIVISDDMVPQVHAWDTHIQRAMDDHFPNLDGCVHFNDGHTNGDLITFSILGRKLYDHFGYIYHPDYKSLYCDDEFTQEVTRMGKVEYIDEIIITHEHWSIEGTDNYGDQDLAVKKTLHYSGRDQQVFNERKRLGFPKERITND